VRNRARMLCIGLAVSWAGVLAGSSVWMEGTSPRARSETSNATQSYQPVQYSDEDYGYGGRPLTPQQREGRDTWYFWTGGNEKFWVEMARYTEGNVDLLNYLDSRRHGRRFRDLGAITQPGCEAATAPDAYGLWLDKCTQPPVPGIPGEPAGIIGLRKFTNPKFDKSKWDAARYFSNPKSAEPPYLIGMACSICHVGFNPLNPPADPERPRWSNLVPGIGNQYWEEGRLFNLKMTPRDFRWHVGNRQAPGTSDTSRFATDHINNPNAINSIFNLSHRPTEVERMRDGSMRPVHHILKDGADSIGVAGASLRVYVNIGMCSDYWTTLHDPVYGIARPQRPFDIAHAEKNCADWRATSARMESAEAFLKTLGPMPLADAVGGKELATADTATLDRGKIAFADTCARCHSSKQPPADVAKDPAKAQEWYRQSVAAADFLDGNFLSDDKRYSAIELGTNIARAAGTNATRGHVWEQFSSETYKALPAVGALRNLYNPQDPKEPITFELKGGGLGYYRTPTLVGMWATAPYLHNNALGSFIKDPSVRGRVVAFYDAVEKLLWPEKRLGVQSISTTSVDSELRISGRTRPVSIPAGTPVDLIARVDPTLLPSIVRNELVLNLLSDKTLFRGFMRNNRAPDFVLDRGHVYGAELSDDDKRALIEFLKTF
jgi:cytochrome c5